MAAIGIVTDAGLIRTMEAASNEGWYIYPTKFGCSAIAGEIVAGRDTPNEMWCEIPISARVIIDAHTLQFICTIPPQTTVDITEVAEIYLFAKDELDEEFLLAVGQPTNYLRYEPTGSLSFRIQIKISSVDIANLYNFNYTQATEITDHNANPAAHPDIHDAIAKAGIFMFVGDFVSRGQFWNENIDAAIECNDGDMVYYDEDGVYKQAITDDTKKEIVAGQIITRAIGGGAVVYRDVIFSGLIDVLLPEEPATVPCVFYLSSEIEGGCTITDTGVPLGTYLGNGKAILRTMNGSIGVGGIGGGGAERFTELLDTPESYTGHGNKLVAVKSDASGLEFISKAEGTGDVAAFTDLSDCPNTYESQAGKLVAVKGTADGLEFVNIPGVADIEITDQEWLTSNTVGTQTWTKPEGVTRAYIDACAGGGGGAPNTDGGIGGGGGEALLNYPVDVSALAEITCTVGAGGVNGVEGGNTVVTAGGLVLTLQGGRGGKSATNKGRGGGATLGGAGGTLTTPANPGLIMKNGISLQIGGGGGGRVTAVPQVWAGKGANALGSEGGMGWYPLEANVELSVLQQMNVYGYNNNYTYYQSVTWDGYSNTWVYGNPCIMAASLSPKSTSELPWYMNNATMNGVPLDAFCENGIILVGWGQNQNGIGSITIKPTNYAKFISVHRYMKEGSNETPSGPEYTFFADYNTNPITPVAMKDLYSNYYNSSTNILTVKTGWQTIVPIPAGQSFKFHGKLWNNYKTYCTVAAINVMPAFSIPSAAGGGASAFGVGGTATSGMGSNGGSYGGGGSSCLSTNNNVGTSGFKGFVRIRWKA